MKDTISVDETVSAIFSNSTSALAECGWRIKSDPFMHFTGSQFRLKFYGFCCLWGREGFEETRGFAGDEPCHREGIRRALRQISPATKCGQI